MRMKPEVEAYRLKEGPYGSKAGYSCGMFHIPYQSSMLRAMVYDGESDGWEHVSVSLRNRTPNWAEMCFIKDLFWDEEETVLQFHVPKSLHVNMHSYCLHMWRNKNAVVDLPNPLTVGVPETLITKIRKGLRDEN